MRTWMKSWNISWGTWKKNISSQEKNNVNRVVLVKKEMTESKDAMKDLESWILNFCLALNSMFSLEN